MNKLTYILTTKEFGRGVYARLDIKKGTVIAVEHILVLNEEDTKKVNMTDLQYYTYKYNGKQDCLVLGDGELYNHSDDDNVGYTVNKEDNTMVYLALQDIEANQQLFIDYGADEKVDTSKYTVNMMNI